MISFLPNSLVEIVQVIEDGEIKDWEGLEFLWDEGVRRRLGLQADDALPPLLLIESPVLLSQSSRERLCQVAFEKFKVPALFMAKTPVMVCFESGRHTGLVVDMGAGSIRYEKQIVLLLFQFLVLRQFTMVMSSRVLQLFNVVLVVIGWMLSCWPC